MNQNKQEIAAATEAVAHYYEQNGFGTVHGYVFKKIASWCSEYSKDTIIKALNQAIQNSCKSYRYVDAILRSWSEANIND